MTALAREKMILMENPYGKHCERREEVLQASCFSYSTWRKDRLQGEPVHAAFIFDMLAELNNVGSNVHMTVDNALAQIGN